MSITKSLENQALYLRHCHEVVIDRICSLNWACLTEADLTAVALAYYSFSVQFRENLEIACMLYPGDPLLKRLAREECATDNLSPWPGIADPGEKLDHDEFMCRLLKLSPIEAGTERSVKEFGRSYLRRIRRIDFASRAASIATYEDGGLEAVFRAILECRHWQTPLLGAFKHFLVRHIEFDSKIDGHGAFTRHLEPTGQIQQLWMEFCQLLTNSAPKLN